MGKLNKDYSGLTPDQIEAQCKFLFEEHEKNIKNSSKEVKIPKSSFYYTGGMDIHFIHSEKEEDTHLNFIHEQEWNKLMLAHPDCPFLIDGTTTLHIPSPCMQGPYQIAHWMNYLNNEFFARRGYVLSGIWTCSNTISGSTKILYFDSSGKMIWSDFVSGF